MDAINDSKQYANDYEHMLYLAGDFSACIDAMTNASGDYNLYNNNCNQKSLSILAQIESPYQEFLEEASEIVIPANSYDYLKGDVIAVNREMFPTFQAFKDYWEAKYD